MPKGIYKRKSKAKAKTASKPTIQAAYMVYAKYGGECYGPFYSVAEALSEVDARGFDDDDDVRILEVTGVYRIKNNLSTEKSGVDDLY